MDEHLPEHSAAPARSGRKPTLRILFAVIVGVPGALVLFDARDGRRPNARSPI